MFELIKELFRKNASILGELPPNAKSTIETMKKPAVMMTDRIFFLIAHGHNVDKDQKNILQYAEKNIFGMPVKIVATKDWNKSKKMQMLMPYNTILFIDLAQHETKGKG